VKLAEGGGEGEGGEESCARQAPTHSSAGDTAIDTVLCVVCFSFVLVSGGMWGR
jgi:hypothetical protein